MTLKILFHCGSVLDTLNHNKNNTFVIKKNNTVQIEMFIIMQVQKMLSVINYLMRQAKEISILNLTIDPS
jgi:hypothetical protein